MLLKKEDLTVKAAECHSRKALLRTSSITLPDNRSTKHFTATDRVKALFKTSE